MRYVETCRRARPATDGNIIRRMSFSCWIITATNKHVECVILVVLPRKLCVAEIASMLREANIACLGVKLDCACTSHQA
jgi:hypothetical protein